MPELRKKKANGQLGPMAILDVVATASRFTQDAVVDYTARHVCTSKEIQGAADNTASTAIRGEKDKHTRYPPAKGITVTPFVQESYGRLGPAAEKTLTDLAAAVVRRNLSFNHPAGHPGKRWRAQLSAHLYKAVARAVRASQPNLEMLGYPAPDPASDQAAPVHGRARAQTPTPAPQRARSTTPAPLTGNLTRRGAAGVA